MGMDSASEKRPCRQTTLFGQFVSSLSDRIYSGPSRLYEQFVNCYVARQRRHGRRNDRDCLKKEADKAWREAGPAERQCFVSEAGDENLDAGVDYGFRCGAAVALRPRQEPGVEDDMAPAMVKDSITDYFKTFQEKCCHLNFSEHISTIFSNIALIVFGYRDY